MSKPATQGYSASKRPKLGNKSQASRFFSFECGGGDPNFVELDYDENLGSTKMLKEGGLNSVHRASTYDGMGESKRCFRQPNLALGDLANQIANPEV